jgi:hypothetical protein
MDSTSDWFSGGIGKTTADGFMTSFWFEMWIGDTPLRVQYQRLFQVSEKSNSKVGEMGTWVDEVGVRPKMEERFVCLGGGSTG